MVVSGRSPRYSFSVFLPCYYLEEGGRPISKGGKGFWGFRVGFNFKLARKERREGIFHLEL